MGAQPYSSLPEYSGKIRLPKHMMVTTTDANTPNADRLLGMYLDLKKQVEEEEGADTEQ